MLLVCSNIILVHYELVYVVYSIRDVLSLVYGSQVQVDKPARQMHIQSDFVLDLLIYYIPHHV